MGPVMAFLPMIGGILSAGMSIFGAISDKKAADANAKAIQRETEEEHRRKLAADKEKVGTALALAGASGTKSGIGSQALFIKTLKDKQKAERDWIGESGGSRATIEKKKGTAALASGLGSSFGSMLGAASKFPT